jgi:hypothetical protein
MDFFYFSEIFVDIIHPSSEAYPWIGSESEEVCEKSFSVICPKITYINVKSFITIEYHQKNDLDHFGPYDEATRRDPGVLLVIVQSNKSSYLGRMTTHFSSFRAGEFIC